ncbi:hypothetical protein HZ326_23780 [Fusarium oxysporum f. sp. albedinis]|nr:hypothetical protein HZ326_23780 [Fusarium oxysporum f. sp. albedinis]
MPNRNFSFLPVALYLPVPSCRNSVSLVLPPAGLFNPAMSPKVLMPVMAQDKVYMSSERWNEKGDGAIQSGVFRRVCATGCLSVNRSQSPSFTALLVLRRLEHGEQVYAPVSRLAMALGNSHPSRLEGHGR